jgi:hypothetical protein
MKPTVVKPLSHKKQHALNTALYAIACEYEMKRNRLLCKAEKVKNGVNFTAETYGFYVMQEWRAHLLHHAWSLPSHIKWLEDLERVQEEQAKNFALALRDYMAMASFGEARYGKNLLRDGHTIRTSIKQCASREGCYGLAPAYQVIPLLQDLESYFGMTETFEGTTGGKPWAVVCKYALTYDTVSAIQFVDTVIDLRHHSDHLFNKPCVFRGPKFYETPYTPSRAIYEKAMGHLWYLPPGTSKVEDSGVRLYGMLLPADVFALAQRGQTLWILPSPRGPITRTSLESDFCPVKWGTKRLGGEYKDQTGEDSPCLVNDEKAA